MIECRHLKTKGIPPTSAGSLLCLDCGAVTSPVLGGVQFVDNAAAVGDVNSDAKGSGARFNAGKIPYEFLPLTLIVGWVSAQESGRKDFVFPLQLLRAVSAWQRRDLDIDAVLKLAVQEATLDAFADAAHVFKHVTERPVKPYPMWNWAKGMKWSVPLGCAVRHLLAEISGEMNDPETSLPHRGHTLCNLIMLLQYSKTYLEGDDRPPKGLL